jgi:hypothetical protein
MPAMPRANHIDHSGHRRPFVAPAAVVGLGALAAVTDFSGSAMAESHRLIGAFAYSNETGGYGYGVNYRNSNDAVERAMRECRARASGADDCVFVKAFGGLCAALTVLELPGTTNDGKPKTFRLHFVGTSAKRSEARDAGVNECKNGFVDPKLREKITDECKVIKVVCSDDRN